MGEPATVPDALNAARFARITLGHLWQEYPHKLDHVMNDDDDVLAPRTLHPIFHGSFDWHSCVHGWWQVLTLARLYPEMTEAAEIRSRADAMLTPALVEKERAYLYRAGSAAFERPYGWAWLLALHGEAARHDAAFGAGWGQALEPLARDFAAHFKAYLPKLTYPIRSGTHANSAFALALALDWAREYDEDLVRIIAQKAEHWFSEDEGCQAWEPGGDEFLSPALSEAMLMSRLLPTAQFTQWFDLFLPDAAKEEPETLFTPAYVSDRSDGKIAHLDGLNLSRAWCWREIAAKLGKDHPATTPALETADYHLDFSLAHIADDYAGTHWLASFALLALRAGKSD